VLAAYVSHVAVPLLFILPLKAAAVGYRVEPDVKGVPLRQNGARWACNSRIVSGVGGDLDLLAVVNLAC